MTPACTVTPKVVPVIDVTEAAGASTVLVFTELDPTRAVFRLVLALNVMLPSIPRPNSGKPVMLGNNSVPRTEYLSEVKTPPELLIVLILLSPLTQEYRI
jgi:hypothetical protein